MPFPVAGIHTKHASICIRCWVCLFLGSWSRGGIEAQTPDLAHTPGDLLGGEAGWGTWRYPGSPNEARASDVCPCPYHNVERTSSLIDGVSGA